MRRIDSKKRNKRTERKIQRLLIVVIFVFSMCRNIEIMLATKELVETMGNDCQSETTIRNDAWKTELCGIIQNQWNKVRLELVEQQEKRQQLLQQPDFFTSLIQLEQQNKLPLLARDECVQLFSVEEEKAVAIETQMEKLYMRDYAINYISERQQTKMEDARQTFYGLVGSVYEETIFSNYYSFINTLYIVDASTRAVKSIFDGVTLMQMDMTVEKKLDEPQILIYHTHSLEAFADSRTGVEADTIVGVGTYLEELLTEKYGYQVLHDKTAYDINQYGYGDRDNAYQRATKGLEAILKQYPSIEIVIDLHRDSRAVTIANVEEKEVAQIMLFNGLCRNVYGPYRAYTNEYLSENLALSLQLKLMGDSLYPGVMRCVYLKSDQYNMHFKSHSLLVEVGTQDNTVEQAKNAMDIFADILNEVLTLK